MKKQNGITIVALVVTIIVLIILAGISINATIGKNGIISKAQEAKQEQEMLELIEEIKIEILAKKQKNANDITQKEVEEILAKYGIVNKNEDGTIKSLIPQNKDYEIPFEEICSETFPLTALDTPDKSTVAAFKRGYGVIEIEFLEGTSYKATTTPNDPNMAEDMKKVYWEEYETEEGTIEVKEILEGDEEFEESKWYSYTAQEGDTQEGGTSRWANAVTVDSDENITGYWVWIPRYAYRIVYFDTAEHEEAYRLTGATEGIVGYSDARGLVHPDGTTPSDMEEPVTSIAVGKNRLRPHPAFEDGSETGYTQGEWDEKLEGIWIAKYETSGTKDALRTVPGVQSLLSKKIGDMYTYSLNYSEEKNSHMLKNSEWGAMLYLADSKYGRNGTKVTANTAGMYTAGGEGATVASNPLQSTTGNYYGIYDVAGGAWEDVPAYITDGTSSNGNSFASTDDTYNNNTESTKYATVYSMITVDSTNGENYVTNINKKFGDGIIETSNAGELYASWNSEDSFFAGVRYGTKYYPFLNRGGVYYQGGPGIFSFYHSTGGGYRTTFRLCILVE